jgi:hypothetical protein
VCAHVCVSAALRDAMADTRRMRQTDGGDVAHESGACGVSDRQKLGDVSNVADVSQRAAVSTTKSTKLLAGVKDVRGHAAVPRGDPRQDALVLRKEIEQYSAMLRGASA